MALIRKAIVDALSKFAVGLSPDDITLDFLTGKGELRNLGKPTSSRHLLQT